ncbi:MAG TPA: ABC-F family ATP-binding cassette domain-containing protein [Nakamurella sp.]|nr:ABC-F family ATP-binding cassette domain-containing protein [Nakamurella sp.]
MANLVNIEAATVVHGMRTVLDGVSIGVQTGDRVGVLGLNGSGKTTLLKLLAGIERPDSGRVATLRNTGVAFVPQASDLPDDRTVREAVLHTLGEAEHVWASDAAVREVLSGLGLPGIGLDTALRTLSGGERRRVALAAALVTDADLLALDEPTNHLDIEAVAWLAGHLQNRRGASVVVTHDRWFLDAIATTTWEVVDGAVLVREGGYSDWVFARAERLRLDRAAEERRKNLARKELAWLRRGPPARTSKPRYRIEAAEAIIAGEPEPRNTVELHAFARRRLGAIVLELEDVWASVPSSAGSTARSTPGLTGAPAGSAEAGERVLLADVTWRVGPGDRIGVVGVNGSGKSTLLRILVGELPLTRGRLKTGTTVHLGYLSQEVAELPGQSRLIEAITEIASVVQLGDKDVSASALAERFGFTPAQQWTRVAELSGGERRRLQLLRILMAEPNVLILDEPTNDLDTDTLSALEDLLDSWPGTLIVVSHDRYLIERVTDDVYALMGDGAITHLPGGVDEYLRRRRESVAAELAELSRASTSTPNGGTSTAGSAGAGGASATQHAAAVRGLRKDLQRLERRLESLQRKESELHHKLAGVGADYAAAAGLNASLLQLHGEVAAAEAEWLAVAEALEKS